MIPVLAYIVISLAGVSVLWGLVTTIANRPPGKAQLLFAALVELVTVVQSLIAGVRLVGGFRPVELATTIGYLLGIVLLVPSPGSGRTPSAPASPAWCWPWRPWACWR